jgi:hypothetical protein
VTTYRLGRMPAKLAAAQAELADCRACPRDCGVNRLQDELGMCKVGRKALVSTVAPHHAEEAPLRGWSGSGTVFFSMCNLRCVFCQNWDLSQQRAGAFVCLCDGSLPGHSGVTGVPAGAASSSLAKVAAGESPAAEGGAQRAQPHLTVLLAVQGLS